MGLRADDDLRTVVPKSVIPAKAGIQRLCFNGQHALIPE
jgi:hypothetical protein